MCCNKVGLVQTVGPLWNRERMCAGSSGQRMWGQPMNGTQSKCNTRNLVDWSSELSIIYQNDKPAAENDPVICEALLKGDWFYFSEVGKHPNRHIFFYKSFVVLWALYISINNVKTNSKIFLEMSWRKKKLQHGKVNGSHLF